MMLFGDLLNFLTFWRRQGGGSGVAKIFEVYDPKRRIFKAFSPVLMQFPTNKFAAGGVFRIFEVYNPERCIFKALPPVFNVISDE